MEKVLERILKNQRGMSFVEVIIASAILGALAMGVTKMVQNANRSTNAVNQKNESNFLVNEINSFFADRSVCTANMQASGWTGVETTNPDDLEKFEDGPTIVNDLFQVDTSTTPNTLTTTSKYKIGKQYRTGRFFLENMGLTKYYMKFRNDGGTEANPLVHMKYFITFRRGSESYGGEKFTKFITITGRINSSNNVVECISSGFSTNGFWQPINGYEGIYYDNGVMGIGTAQPSDMHSLHLHEEDKPTTVLMTRGNAPTQDLEPLTRIIFGGLYDNDGDFDDQDPTQSLWSFESVPREVNTWIPADHFCKADCTPGDPMEVNDMVFKSGTQVVLRMRKDYHKDTLPDDNFAGPIVSTPGNFYTNSELTASQDFIVGWGEYGGMLKYGESLGIKGEHVYGFGWCSHFNCGRLYVGMAVPDNQVFTVYSRDENYPGHLATIGSVFSQHPDDIRYFGFAPKLEWLLQGPQASPFNNGGQHQYISGFYLGDSGQRIYALTHGAGIEVDGDTNIIGTLTANNVSATSDARMKKDVEQVGDALATILKIRGVNFKWNKDDKPSIGVIAQEVEKYFPDLVFKDEKGFLSVNYNGLIAVMIEALREQNEQVLQMQKQQQENTKLIQKLFKEFQKAN